MPVEGNGDTTVWLIRHGESSGNVGRETTDPARIPLTSLGERQAARVAEVFEHAPDLIVTSPFLRARQTAGATIARFPATPVEHWEIEEFTYLGSVHDRPTTGAERRPLVDAYWSRADPSYRDDHRSESFMDVVRRAHEFLERVSRRGGERVAAFTHGLFMRIVLWVLLTGEIAPDTESMRRFYRFRTAQLIPNCSIITLWLHPQRGGRLLGGATSHLPHSLRTGE